MNRMSLIQAIIEAVKGPGFDVTIKRKIGKDLWKTDTAEMKKRIAAMRKKK